MPPKSVHNQLNYYSRVLSRSTDRIFCPDCKISMLPKIFPKHCSQQHDISDKTRCVWCRRLSWENGKKYQNAKHLIDCFRDFMKSKSISYRQKQIGDIKSYRLLTMDHAFTEKDFYDHVLANSPNDLTSSTYDCIWPLETDPFPIIFADENLNLAASYVQKYLETKDSHDWLHVMVKVVSFKSFVRAMDEDQGSSRTLQFSCWCDGGAYEEAKHRQHRHVIVVSHIKGRFEREVWPKVQVSPEDKPNPNFPCKRSKEINSPLYLVNCMGYLSSRKSRCKFSFKNNNKIPFQFNHFYLYKTLPKSFKLHLVQLWANGVAQLLYQTKFQNVSVARLAGDHLIYDGNQWKQIIKHFYKHVQGLVLNVSKQFAPTDRVTPYFFHLMGDEKLYFDCSPENEALDDETWLRKQIAGGNCFYDVVEENTWIPRKKVQQILNFHMPVVNRKNELEIENASLKEEMCSLKEELCSLKNEYQKEIEISKAENQSKQAIINKLNDQNKSQQLKITEQDNEIKHYLLNISKLQDAEIERLKAENQKLKGKIVKLQNRLSLS